MSGVKSKVYSINFREILKGLSVAVIGAVVTYAVTAMQSGDFFPIQWAQIGTVALTSGMAYIKLTFFSNEDGAILKKK